MNFATEITTIAQAKSFIEALHANGMMFHFEDSPETIINGTTGEPLFTPEESENVSARVAEMYALDWSEVGEECPIGYALTLMDGWAE